MARHHIAFGIDAIQVWMLATNVLSNLM